MIIGYADPPYPGQAKRLYGNHPDYAGEVDHLALAEKLVGYDGWCLHTSSVALPELLPMISETLDEFRIMAWVKTFAAFKPNVPVAYAWEPVIFRGGRKRSRAENTTRDWCAVNIALMRGFPGAKPEGFVRWFLEVMNARRDDVVDDIFLGSGAVTKAIEQWRREPDLMSLQPGAEADEKQEAFEI